MIIYWYWNIWFNISLIICYKNWNHKRFIEKLLLLIKLSIIQICKFLHFLAKLLYKPQFLSNFSRNRAQLYKQKRERNIEKDK